MAGAVTCPARPHPPDAEGQVDMNPSLYTDLLVEEGATWVPRLGSVGGSS